ncbi:hypothetical protein HY948_04750 [Candidatus Gottesmanbacteria bacterium]|nr:hypothetical protein [Candidatus Gottesmanbacteria bacterium]
MNILGISCDYHDSAAVLVRDGILVSAAQEERFTRLKNDSSIPRHAVDFCLSQGNIGLKDIDRVAFYEKPFRKFHRILLSSLATYPAGLPFFVAAMRSFLLEKLWIKNKIIEELHIPEDRVSFVPHHISHGASTFFASPYCDATIVTIDGVGEWATSTIGKGKDNNITVMAEQQFPHSLGLLYSTITAFLGFEVNEGEYKVMGMAPFGKPIYADKIWKLLNLFPDSSFRLNLEYFSFQISESSPYSSKLISLLGKPRDPGSHFFTKRSGFPSYFGKKPADYAKRCEENQHFADIAASLQYVAEHIIFSVIRHAYTIAPSKNLCLAGGVFLNSVANGKLQKNTPFQHIYIQPAAGDAGGALGAALYVNRTVYQSKPFIMTHAYWGKEFSETEILHAAKSYNLSFRKIRNTRKLNTVIINAIMNEKVVGWFNGRSEWGPRALGNRSILADPRDPAIKDIVNTKIKFREPFRPFAASVLAGHEHEIFDIPASPGLPINFMLCVYPVNKKWRKKIPAVTHVNGTSRPQVVNKKDNKRYWELINDFYKKTGVPLLLNTSFNIKGEPIVNTPTDAIQTFLTSELDLLVMGNFIITKQSNS